MKNQFSQVKFSKYGLVLLMLMGSHLMGQEVKIQIETNSNEAAVYSVNGFMGETRFKGSVDFDKVKELYVVGNDGLFEVVRKEDFKENMKIEVASFPLATLNGQFKDVKLGQVQILTEKLDPAAPNAYAHNAIYDQDFLNEELKNFGEDDDIFATSKEDTYILSGVIQKDIVFWDGYNPNKNKCLFVDVKWTLRDSKNRIIILEKLTTGGYYFGEVFKPKNQADIVETTGYAYRKAVVSSLIQVLRSEEMTSKSYELPTTSENVIKKTLTIKAGTDFCSEIDKCAGASVSVQTQKSLGSGFFISNDGYILTNYHVIENEQHPTIRLSSGISLPVEVIRWDEDYDVALLKASINSVTAIRITDDNAVTNGEDVFAIGSPKDISLAQTTSRGIVSSYRLGEKPMIQTDVSVNSGNSGGALLNIDNEVIGIVTSKIIEVGVEGIAFAIPIKDALTVLNLKIE